MPTSRAALAATRSLELLDFLAARPGQGHTLTELAKGLVVNPSSMHGILNVMTEAGYLVRHPVHKTYRLGPIAAAIGQAAVLQDPVVELAVEEVAQLTCDFEVESVVLAAVRDEMVVIARSGPSTGRFLSFVGQRWPHIPPMGSIFVAWSDDDIVERWLAAVDPPLDGTGRAQYKEVLERVHDDGRAVVIVEDNAWKLASHSGVDGDVNGTCLPGARLVVPFDHDETYRVFYIGHPVFNSFGAVTVGLFVNGSSTRLSVDRINEVSQRLGDAATRIMNRTGGRPPFRFAGVPGHDAPRAGQA